MTVQTVGIHSPGDMGMGVGQVLAAHGIKPIAALDARSARTKGLAAKAGITDVGSLANLVQQADIILSILVPSAAMAAADQIAAALRETGATVLYADCNAISLASTRALGEVITRAGSRYVDGSITGPPPRGTNPSTVIWASGPEAEELAQLNQHGLTVRVLGQEIGQASGIKTSYAALTKGMAALATQLLLGAKRQGLLEPLQAEFAASQPWFLPMMEKMLPKMPPKAHRWVGEMEEHAATYEALGMTPLIMQGSADFFAYLATTPPGKESPEEADPNPTLDSLLERLDKAE